MLTEKIESLRAVIDHQRSRGVIIDLDQMAALTGILDDWARYCRSLEQATIPPAARLDWANLPAGVTPLPRRRPATRPVATTRPDGAA
jgi:hypothetical protein